MPVINDLMREKARQYREQRKALGLSIRKSWAEKIAENPNSLRIAIDAKCWDCVCGDHNVNARQLISGCTIKGCALHHVRPYQIKCT